MMYLDLEKGWIPTRFRGDVEWADPMTKVEYYIHLLSRVKWGNVAIALVILMGFSYGIISMTKDVMQSLPAWQEERHLHYVEEETAKYDKVEILVQQGDTAWSIQQKLTPNEHDLRHPLYLAEELNEGMNVGKLLPGQILVFLKEKSGK